MPEESDNPHSSDVDRQSGSRISDGRDAELDSTGDSDFDRLLREVARSPDALRPPLAASRLEAAFRGRPRFRIRRRLGEGGFGTVFEVEDRGRGEHVALKVLHRTDGASLYRFKREFRALAGLSHPHLVMLHELFADRELWYLTMELVAGHDFVRHVTAQPPAAPEQPAVDIARLRSALAQLVAGLRALHGAGLLHRDLKPSNVLVTPAGRVVVLDFGLVTRAANQLTRPSVDAAGTPAYMPPECWDEAPPSEAGDFYAVGVMLYEALTGRLPFRSSPPAGTPPPVPSGTPPDLAALCRDLLARDPADRPTGDELARRLGDSPTSHAPSVLAINPAPPAPLFAGRTAELAALDAAFVASQRGAPVRVLLHGPSGIGKSTLAEHFLACLRQREPDAVVLAGRCYVRESVPFKALDGVIDALSRHLRSVPDRDAESLLPGDVLPLLRLFPVLGQVPALARARRRVIEASDMIELRQRASAALRELIARLAYQVPVILAVDDLHWGDVDSAQPLGELLCPPQAPPLLFLGTVRDGTTSPLLDLLVQSEPGTDVRRLAVGALDSVAAQDLAAALQPHGSAAQAARIAEDAGGHPLYITELARHAGETVAEPAEPPGTALSRMLARRVAQLEPPARRLLAIVAVAGQPLERIVAVAAAELPGDRQLVSSLCAARLLHLVPVPASDGSVPASDGRVDVYHDQVRQSVLASLSPAERAEHHRRLAHHLAAAGAEPETLAVHFLESGDSATARQHLLEAARQAMELLAFERAAALYRRALDLPAAAGPAPGAVRELLGEALGHAGHSAEAGRIFLEAATPGRADLLLRAARELLRSGHIDEGQAIARQALGMLGIHLAAGPRRARIDFVVQRVRLRVARLAVHGRASAPGLAALLERADACWSLGLALLPSDFLLGFTLLQRHARFALAAGEPGRVACAMATEALIRILLGGDWDAAAVMLARAESMAAAHDSPALCGYILGFRAIACLATGRPAECLALCERAEPLLRNDLGNASHIITVLRNQRHFALYLLGRWQALVQEYAGQVADYRRRGDRYSEVTQGVNVGWLGALLDDDPAAAMALVDELMASWSQREFHLQHLYALVARTEIDLYAGRAAQAVARLDAVEPLLWHSVLVRIRVFRFRCLALRCRAMLASMAEGRLLDRQPSEARRQLARVDRILGQLARPRLDWQQGMLAMLHALRAELLTDQPGALAHLAAADEILEPAGIQAVLQAVRGRRGRLLGGDAGARLVAESEAFFRAEGAREPSRIIRVLI
jgi:eukaryotic-like serine/threonine-protein kinase